MRLEKIPVDTLILGANYIRYLEAKIGKFRARPLVQVSTNHPDTIRGNFICMGTRALKTNYI